MNRKVLILPFALLASALYAQSCMPTAGTTGANLSNIEIGSIPPSADGFVHVTYAFDSTVDANTQNLFASAAQQWNTFEGITGAIFEPMPAGSNIAPNITMGLNFEASGGCIAIDARNGQIAFNNGWQQLELNSPTTAIGSIAQELGHFLGLADAGVNPNPPTIMNNPPFQLSCADEQVPVTAVQPNDAQVAAGCAAQALSIQSVSSGGGHQVCFVDGNCYPCDPLCSPIILDTEAEGFHLTSAEAGVMFDIAGDGHPVQIAWTDPGYHNAFLALPGPDGLVHNGKELFGNFTPQPASAHPNGFIALAQYDKPENGGNGDGIIDEHDEVYAQLRLWIDENHDGICQPNELHRLPELGVYSLALGYEESRRTDQFGNQFRYKARVNPGERRDPRDETPTGDPGRRTYDVFFVIK